ncbi:MAG TPA: ATP-binding protein [Acetobacteraceae bacterium]|jgi:signal transduction histidine kinase/CheY-like chemotaxis protein|nr:ATP-binding protein [Acetobacteraceae bacterium]
MTMIDAAMPMHNAMAVAAGGARRATFRRLIRRLRLGVRMHHLLFMAFILVAAVPVIVLALWDEKTSYQHELDSVRERHLLVARNLTSTMSRYLKDVKATFSVAFESSSLSTPIPGLSELLKSLDVVHVCIVAPDGTIERWLPGLAPAATDRLDAKFLAELRSVAATPDGSPGLTNLEHNSAGRPVFYLAKQLPDNRIGLGVLTTDYLVSLQQAIAFGDHGHAVITDAKGQVIAHPLKDWVAASRDISGVPVVAAMMRGETGVGQFYSPAFNGNMIAGFAVVPETGWGVMVPQPLSELRRRAGEVAELATVIAGTSFAVAAFMSWLFAFWLARPVRQVAFTAEAVLAGSEEVSAPSFSDSVPLEIRQLGLAFNTMLQDLRRRNAEIRHALHDAETSSLAKTQFLANMSHEIRTPLNGVVGMIELLRLSDPSPGQQRYLEAATQSSQTLLRLIDDILDLSKIDAGKLELERAAFHLPSLIHDARSMFSDQARAKGLALSASVASDLNVILLGDAHRLLQILTNLVGNALKFTSEGMVSIGVTCLEDRGSSLRLRFVVTDSGIGIPASKQDAIFDAFSQADSSTTRRYGGTGLGLSIARQLCHLMGGEIGVDSAVGKGSTFWFTAVIEKQPTVAGLPPVLTRSEPPPQPAEPQDTTQRALSPAQREFREALGRTGLSTIRILLVEDNPANLRVTQALLEAIGCTVTTARNGLEAVSAYRDGSFDLVLMDCQMPEMDGYEAARAIRQLEEIQAHATPIVALTAHALDGSRELSLAAGMSDHLTKPLTMAMLTAKLVEWIGAKPAA